MNTTAGLGSCDFDSGELCSGYIQDSSDHFNWTVHNGTTPSWHTGPTGDFNTGHGMYLYPILSNWILELNLAIRRNEKPGCVQSLRKMCCDGKKLGKM